MTISQVLLPELELEITKTRKTLYLRMNDIPVPALYGPSADEGV